jgi:peroxiredoxin
MKGPTMVSRMILAAVLGSVIVATGCTTGPTAMGRKPCPSAPEGIQPLIVGTRVPDIALWSPEGKKVVLGSLLAQKPTILVVYRGGWCVYCQQELAKLQTIEPELKQLGYQVIAISPDSPAALKRGLAKQSYNYALLSDQQMEAATVLGLAYNIDAGTRQAIERFDAGATSGVTMLPVPAVFIVSQDSVIRFEYVNPNIKEQIDPQLLLTAARCMTLR